MSTKISEMPMLSGIAGTLATIADIATAPKSGTSGAARGSIVAALVLLIGLAYAGTVLERPETERVMQIAIVKQLAAHSSGPAASAQTSHDLARMYTKIVPVIGLVLLVGQQFAAAGLILVAVLTFNGRVSYTKVLYIVVHTSVLTIGLAQLALGLIHFIRGPAGYDTPLSMQLGMPSLAWLISLPPQGEVVLAALNPFTLWQATILTFWIAHAARLSLRLACVAACLPLCLFTLLASMYAAS